VFQRGEAAVTIGFTHDEEKIRDGRHKATLPADLAVLRIAEPENVLLAMERGFRVLRHNHEGKVVPADVSTKLARVVLKNTTFRPVLRVVRSPTLRHDGSVLEVPGYDPGSALVYTPGEAFPQVPTNPTREDARRALERLQRPFRGFPFVSDVDRAVILAEVLTIITRHLYAKAPGFVHRAAEAGIGKTLAADVAAIIASGSPASNVASSILDDIAELRKLLTTWTLRSVPVGLIDNIPRGSVVDNSEINRFVTAELYGDRLLGSNKELMAPVITTLVLTGNRLDARGDVTRRLLFADLDADMERPETREFEFDAVVEARGDCAELVIAVLTLLRAYIVAGLPTVAGCAEPFGSFEAWSKWVRQPLVWAGSADPVKALEKTRGSDEERGSLCSVLAELYAVFNVKPFRAKLVIKAAEDNPDLQTTLMSIVANKDRTAISPERLGRYLKNNAGRTVGEYKLTYRDDPNTHLPEYAIRRGVLGSSGGFSLLLQRTQDWTDQSTRTEFGSKKNAPEPPGSARWRASLPSASSPMPKRPGPRSRRWRSGARSSGSTWRPPASTR
jgi:hypothetical protein